jgi:hypothetical protein
MRFLRFEFLEDLSEEELLRFFEEFSPLLEGSHFQERAHIYMTCLEGAYDVSEIAKLNNKAYASVWETVDNLKKKKLMYEIKKKNKEYKRFKPIPYYSCLEPFRPLIRYLIKSKMWNNANLKKEDLRKIENLFFDILGSEIGRQIFFPPISYFYFKTRKIRESEPIGKVAKFYQEYEHFHKVDAFLEDMCYFSFKVFDELFYIPLGSLLDPRAVPKDDAKEFLYNFYYTSFSRRLPKDKEKKYDEDHLKGKYYKKVKLLSDKTFRIFKIIKKRWAYPY